MVKSSIENSGLLITRTLHRHKHQLRDFFNRHNRFLYLKYVDVANEMCSYQATNESLDRSAVDPNVFIHQIDTTLGSLNKIAVGSELSQIPDFSKALNQALGQTGAGNTGEAQTKSLQSPNRKRTK
jgi:hypothetical protein